MPEIIARPPPGYNARSLSSIQDQPMRRPSVLAPVLSAVLLSACGGSSRDGGAPADSEAASRAASREGASPAAAPVSSPGAARSAAPSAAPVEADQEGAPGVAQTQPSGSATPAPSTGVWEPTGTTRVAMDLSTPFELAGLELHLRFDGDEFRASKPETTEQLTGYLCADNPGIPGGFKYICASIPPKRAEGRLAVLPFAYRTRPLRSEDLEIQKVSIVDANSVEAPAGVTLSLTVLD